MLKKNLIIISFLLFTLLIGCSKTQYISTTETEPLSTVNFENNVKETLINEQKIEQMEIKTTEETTENNKINKTQENNKKETTEEKKPTKKIINNKNNFFTINGKIYELNITTAQELIDDGVSLDFSIGNELSAKYNDNGKEIKLILKASSDDETVIIQDCTITKVIIN